MLPDSQGMQNATRDKGSCKVISEMASRLRNVGDLDKLSAVGTSNMIGQCLHQMTKLGCIYYYVK